VHAERHVRQEVLRGSGEFKSKVDIQTVFLIGVNAFLQGSIVLCGVLPPQAGPADVRRGRRRRVEGVQAAEEDRSGLLHLGDQSRRLVRLERQLLPADRRKAELQG